MNNLAHPSFLELDKIHVGGGSAAAQDHVRNCEQCGAHLAKLSLPVAIPVSLTQAGIKRPSRWIGFVSIGMVAAACSILTLAVVPRLMDDRGGADGFRAKAAAPGIAVFLKRGEKVAVWDGQSPLQAGDLIRLQVAPQGLRRVRVTSPIPGGAPTVLYEGDLPSNAPSLLPVSFAVDPVGSQETLRIELSRGAPGEETWSTQLVIPKNPHPGVQP